MASTGNVLRTRLEHYGPNTSLNYAPSALHMVSGNGTLLFDNEGQSHLDCVNNVAALGHAHPKIAQAVSEQLSTLNTNSRYLHHALTEYTQELLATLPPELQVLYMVNSGSEANDLALRIATTARPGATHVVVMGSAYHGHTGALIDLSPYKFWGKGGQGRKPHVHVIPCPDPYRGEHLDGHAAARAVVAQARAAGGRVCAFFAESILSCGGQVVMPPGYLQDVLQVMRGEGAVCVADEVQCGFARVGSSFWGFQVYDGIIPDIVTMGKPMGNGYPVAGLVTTRALADAFNNGMEYFNTFGGSTGAAVAALATLRCIKEERRQEHAHKLGQYLLTRLREVQSLHPDIIGDVRGVGLMVGLDVVTDPVTKAHAPAMAKWIKDTCKVRRVLLSTDGPYDNVIKIKPPLVFDIEHVDILVDTLKRVLSEDLTPHVRAHITKQEEHLWAQTYGPRMAQYRANEAELGLAPRQAQAAHATTVLTRRMDKDSRMQPGLVGLAFARIRSGQTAVSSAAPQLQVVAASHAQEAGVRSRL